MITLLQRSVASLAAGLLYIKHGFISKGTCRLPPVNGELLEVGCLCGKPRVLQ